MTKPAYINEFGKPVYKVGNAHIKKVEPDLYELQFNNEYFLISKDMLQSLANVTKMSDNISLSIG